MSGSKVILVTGASSGIGRATADLLHARGHRVFGSSRNPARHEAPWSLVGLDVTEGTSVAACIEAILAAEGRIDAVVNNAGLVMAGAVEDTSPEEALRTFETNVIGAIRVTRAVLPAMRSCGSGVIVNVGSLAGRVGMPFQGLYSASKFALEGLTEALRQEVAGAGIRVALVAPGDTATPVVENRVRTSGSAASASAYAADFARIVAMYEADERAGVPAGRVAARIADIIDGRRRSPRQVVGPLPQRVMVASRNLIPGGVFRWGMSRYFGLRR